MRRGADDKSDGGADMSMLDGRLSDAGSGLGDGRRLTRSTLQKMEVESEGSPDKSRCVCAN